MPLSDQDLVNGIRRKDQKTINTFISRYIDYIYHLAMKTLSNASDAEEVTNDVFMKAIDKIDQLTEHTSIKSWMYAITYRMCIDKIRSRKQHLQVDDSHQEYFVETSSPDQYLVHNDNTKMVDELLNFLSNEDALLMRLYYLQECKIKEVAETTGLSEENIKTRLFRARKLLSSKTSFVR